MNQSRLKMLAAQRVHRLLQSDLYNEVEPILNDTDREALSRWIDESNDKLIRGMLKSKLEVAIGAQSIGELRTLARRMNILYYTKYTKWELISVILHRKEEETKCSQS
jgi:hypothetical protein